MRILYSITYFTKSPSRRLRPAKVGAQLLRTLLCWTAYSPSHTGRGWSDERKRTVVRYATPGENLA